MTAALVGIGIELGGVLALMRHKNALGCVLSVVGFVAILTA